MSENKIESDDQDEILHCKHKHGRIRMEIMRQDGDLHCRDFETHEFLGILREVPNIPNDGRYYHYHIRVTGEAPYWHPVSRAEIPQWKAGGISEHFQFRWN